MYLELFFPEQELILCTSSYFCGFFPCKSLCPRISHVLAQSKMDCEMAVSDNPSDSVRRIQSVAQTAINNIYKLVSLVEQRGSANPGAAKSWRSSIEPERLADTTNASQSINALDELRRRFPTCSRGGGPFRAKDQSTGRYERSSTSFLYTSTSVRRSVGRPPASDIISKDVIIVEIRREKIQQDQKSPIYKASVELFQDLTSTENGIPKPFTMNCQNYRLVKWRECILKL